MGSARGSRCMALLPSRLLPYLCSSASCVMVLRAWLCTHRGMGVGGGGGRKQQHMAGSSLVLPFSLFPLWSPCLTYLTKPVKCLLRRGGGEEGREAAKPTLGGSEPGGPALGFLPCTVRGQVLAVSPSAELASQVHVQDHHPPGSAPGPFFHDVFPTALPPSELGSNVVCRDQEHRLWARLPGLVSCLLP